MSPPTKSARRWRAVALLALLLAFAWNALSWWPYVVDDAFISLRYARNLVDGNGLVFNVGERVEGYSNFSWVLLASLVLELGLPLVTSMRVLGLLSGAGAILLTYKLVRRLLADEPLGEVFALLAAGLLAFNTSLALWSGAGLETSFFALLLVAAVLRFELELTTGARRLPLSAVLFALCWMTRPEAPAYGLYFAVRRLSCLRSRPARRGDALWLGALALPVGAYELWGLWYYGHLLPATHTAKLGGERPGLLAALFSGRLGGSLVGRFATRQGLGFSSLLALGALGSLRAPRRIPAAAWATTVAGLVFGFYAWRDWMPRYRLLVPMLPFLCAWLACGWLQLHRVCARVRWGGAAFGAVLAAALLGQAHHQATAGYEDAGGRDGFARDPRAAWMTALPEFTVLSYEQEPEAWRILSKVPEGEWVGIPNIGFAGFLTMNPIWDVRGLVTPSVAAARNAPGEETLAAVLEDFLERAPAYVLLPEGGEFTQLLDDLLSSDRRALKNYARSESPAGNRTLYVRRRIEPFDQAERIHRALERFPEYRR